MDNDFIKDKSIVLFRIFQRILLKVALYTINLTLPIFQRSSYRLYTQYSATSSFPLQNHHQDKPFMLLVSSSLVFGCYSLRIICTKWMGKKPQNKKLNQK